jgi:hypothetical protein
MIVESRIKNNNPGRMQKGPRMFIGEIPDDTEDIYRKFYDVIWGYRAMFSQLQMLINLHQDTIKKMVTGWEPRTRYTVERYTRFIEMNTSLKRDEQIKAEEKLRLVKIVSAISHLENDEIPNEEEILKAWELLPMKKYQ